jgi:hypothetical protein
VFAGSPHGSWGHKLPPGTMATDQKRRINPVHERFVLSIEENLKSKGEFFFTKN